MQIGDDAGVIRDDADAFADVWRAPAEAQIDVPMFLTQGGEDGIPQALRMMNSPVLNNGGKALEEAMNAKTPTQAIDYLYLATLSRYPTDSEKASAVVYLKSGGTAALGQKTEDLQWVLLNSLEFLFD